MAAKGIVGFALLACVACSTSFDRQQPELVEPVVDGGTDVVAPLDAGAPAIVPDASVSFDAGIDATDPGAPGPIIFTGAVDRILLTGLVVTPDTAFDGEVLVEGSMITCVGTGGVCGALPAAAGATLVLKNGVIAPGMIDWPMT